MVTRCDASLVVRGGSVDRDDTRLPTHKVEEVKLTREVINQVQVDEIEAWMMVGRAWGSRRTAGERKQVLGEIKEMKSCRESNLKVASRYLGVSTIHLVNGLQCNLMRAGYPETALDEKKSGDDGQDAMLVTVGGKKRYGGGVDGQRREEKSGPPLTISHLWS